MKFVYTKKSIFPLNSQRLVAAQQFMQKRDGLNTTAKGICGLMKKRLCFCIVWCFWFSIVAGCDVSQSKKTTVTVKIKKPYLYPDYCAEVEQLLWRHTAKAFRRFKAPSDALKNEAFQFLKDACHYSSHNNLLPRPIELEARGRQLVENGVASSVVRMWWGYLLYKCEDYPESWKQHRDVLTERPSMAYLLAAYAADDLCDMAYDNDYPMRAERVRWKDAKAVILQKAILEGEFQKNETHIAYQLITENLGTKAIRNLLSKLKQAGDIDPWLLLMLEGKLAIKDAWKSRGSDLAHTVTKAGWQGFHEHLEKAREPLTNAWKLRPKYPQAANEMITVAMGGHPGPGESERAWFDRAIKAQPDNLTAHSYYLYALKPRWGGSYRAMESLGRERLCLGPYNSQAPLFYMLALKEIGGDIENDCWRAVFRSPGVLENLERLFQTLIEEPPLNIASDRLRMQYALVLAWCGQYARAKEILEGLPADMDLRREGIIGQYLSWQGRSRQEIEAELRAFLGPMGETLVAAEKKQHQGDFEGAADLFLKAMKASQSDREVHAYLRRRIGLMGLDIRAEHVHWYGTALHYAAQKDNLPVACFLVENGADVNARTSNDSTPLHWAATNGKTAIAQYLMENGALIDSLADSKETPLHYALKEGHPDFAIWLIEKGAASDATDRDHISVLYRATELGNRRIIKLLLEKGADVNVATITNWTSIYQSVRSGEAEILKLLLDHNADPDICPNNAYPPLIKAVYVKSVEMVRLLLEHGANANVIHDDKDGWTPLLMAAYTGNETIVRMLLEAGADDTICLSNGADAAEVARVNGHKKLCKFLQSRK
jgi:ankyrin repeat protein